MENLKLCKLLTGYYVIETDTGKRLTRKPDYNTMIFEYKKDAQYVIKSINKNGLPDDLILI
jgi:hypothetical protein